MDNDSMKELLKALDNDENETLMNLTTNKINKLNNDNLQLLRLPRDELKKFHKKVKGYRHVSELDDIQFGNYIRWIPLRDPNNIKMTNGAFIIDIKTVKESGIHVVCKNSMNRVFNMILNECIVFQKMNQQEKILIKIIDYASK